MPGYITQARFFRDSNQTTTIHWYRVPADRPCLPVGSFVEDSDWTNNNGPRSTIYKGVSPDLQGEQWVDRPAVRLNPLPGELYTGHYCGTPTQWAGQLDLANPDDVGEYGCCNPDLLGAYNCDFANDFDNFGPCP